jgi:hypothetical protein
MKNLWKNKWFKALVIFLPFTGVIHADWFILLFVSYFFVGGYYLMFHTEPFDKSKLVHPDGGKWDGHIEEKQPDAQE